MMNKLFSDMQAPFRHKPHQLTKRSEGAIRSNMGKKLIVLSPVVSLVVAGCVQVQAPDKPIVINLNISIRQEILYKLDEASKKAIEDNPGIF